MNADGTYTIGVFDGGTSEYGEVLKKHFQKYYFDGAESGRINFVVCSHPHLDHASGLSVILENFEVDELYMNRPWVHVDSLFDKANNGHITRESLKRRLKEKYKYISALEEIAEERGISIYDAFEGDEIAGKLTVLSPSEEFYLELLVESDKTPLEESDSASLIQAAQRFVKKIANCLHRERHRSSEADGSQCVPAQGARVYNASGSSVQHHVGLPLHPGWGTADPVEFDHNVEEWT